MFCFDNVHSKLNRGKTQLSLWSVGWGLGGVAVAV